MNNDAIAGTTMPQSSSEEINALFARLQPQDVEQFYQSFQLWTLQRQIETLQVEIAALKEAIAENAVSLEETRPSAIALATLAQLQSRGVDDLDLLDKMLERGESWLDHTMQLHAYCERFGVMRSNYTEWCEHALEGAYDWIRSMKEAGAASMPPRTPADHEQRFDEATEALLLQKLMSEGEETIKIPSIARERAKITQPLTRRKITQPLAQRKITQPLGESALLPEDSTVPADAAQESTPSAAVTEFEPESVVIVSEPLPGGDTEVPPAAVVATPAEIEGDAGSMQQAEQAEEDATPTGTEPEAAVASVTEPGAGVSELESTGTATEPDAVDEGTITETISAGSDAEPAAVAAAPAAIDASSTAEPVTEVSEQAGDAVGAPQEVASEVSIPTEPQAGDAVGAPQEVASEVSIPTEPQARDAVGAPRATASEVSIPAEPQAGEAVGAPRATASKPAPGVDDEAAKEGPAAMTAWASEEPAIIDAAHPELEDTRPLQKIIAPPPEILERVEDAPAETESTKPSEESAPAAPDNDISRAETVPFQPVAPQWRGANWPTPQPGTEQMSEQESQYQAQPEQRPRKRRRFFLWRWLARLWRR